MQRAKHMEIRGFMVLVFLVANSLAHAASPQPFDDHAFQAAQALGKPILVEISADWCPNCRAQRPIIDKIFGESKYSNMARVRVDFDIHQCAVEEFNVRFLSTLVLFKGKVEVARSVGELDEAKIRFMLNKALPSPIQLNQMRHTREPDLGAQLRAGTR